MNLLMLRQVLVPRAWVVFVPDRVTLLPVAALQRSKARISVIPYGLLSQEVVAAGKVNRRIPRKLVVAHDVL